MQFLVPFVLLLTSLELLQWVHIRLRRIIALHGSVRRCQRPLLVCEFANIHRLDPPRLNVHQHTAHAHLALLGCCLEFECPLGLGKRVRVLVSGLRVLQLTLGELRE